MGLKEAVPKARERSELSSCNLKPKFSEYLRTLSIPTSLKSLIETRLILCSKASLNLVGP